MRADNTHHLRAAAQHRAASSRARAETALTELTRTGEPLTPTSLARAAAVSRSWIYTQPDLIARIQATPRRQPLPSRAVASDESWQRRLELAHTRIRELTLQNSPLRHQLAIAHGQLRNTQPTSTTPSTTQNPNNPND